MKLKSPGYRACVVVDPGPPRRHIWKFQVGKDKLTKLADISLQVEAPLPPKAVSRDWRHLVQPTLHIACLPPGLTFIRAVQLPAGAPEEIPGMVEFELEKLSPLPPAQIVWTYEVLDRNEQGLSTILVVIAERSAIEEFLSRLETSGYVTDRLEIPLIRELALLAPTNDGIWIIADDAVGERTVLVGWRVGGVWREVTLLRLAEGEPGTRQLVQQMECVAWAGELSGWLSAVPPVNLMGSPDGVHALETAVQEWCGEAVRTAPRIASEILAQAAAQFHLNPTGASLVPSEAVERHRNAMIDGLWVRGLVNAGITYLFLVFCYMAALKYREHQLEDAQDRASALGRQFTNTLQLKERIAVIQGQIDLRFAALNAWRAAVERLPESMTLSKLNFEKGRTLKLLGTVPSENIPDVTRFNSELKKVVIDGQPLFSKVAAAQFSSQGGSSTWSFDAELRRSETP